MSKNSELKTNCRICKSYGSVHMFSVYVNNGEIPLSIAYAFLTNLEIFEDDPLPKYLCSSCAEHLDDAYYLKRQAQRTFNEFYLKHEESIGKAKDGLLIEEVIGAEYETSSVYAPESGGEEEPVHQEVEVFVVDSKNQEYEQDESLDQSQSESQEYKEPIEDAVELLSQTKNEPQPVKPPKSTKEKKFKCNVCSKLFIKQSNLMDHLHLHANLKRFKCPDCDKSFVQVANYRTHIRVHTKEKPFECDLCSKRFTQSSTMKIHRRSHTNERNYICDICSKAFTNSSDMNKHKKIHNPALHLKCMHCDKSFVQKVNLRNHYRKYHPEHSPV